MYYLILINIAAWIVYGLDKWKARTGKWRIPEKTLLFLAFAGGSLGALFAMILFRHKTRKTRFVVLVPVFFVFHCVVLAVIFQKFL